MTVTLQQLLIEGTEQLKQAQVPDAKLDAQYLLMEAFGLTASSFLQKRGQELEPGKAEEQAMLDSYYEMMQKRCQRIPLQYITGVQYFMGLEFLVDRRVLIPRQDTEDLVERVLRENPGKDTRILDMCTGSGCIAVSLAVLGGYEQVTAVDVSRDALAVASENIKRLSVSQRVRCVESSLYEEKTAILGDGGEKYHVIVSNPPYIPTEVIQGLQPEVRDYEPALALDGTEDGLYFYRLLAKESREFLAPGGKLYLEIGYDQGAAVAGLLCDAGYTEIEVIKDTPGLDRIVKAAAVAEIPAPVGK